MVKPPPGLAAMIGEFSRTGSKRGSHLLHVTLLKLGDLADRGPGFLLALIAIMRDFEAPAFQVCFDRVHEHRCVTLQGSERLRGVKAFQMTLMRFLAQRGVAFGAAPDPHLTIHYGRDGLGREEVDPVSWRVSELLLIESLVGQAEHEEHGRWALRTADAA